MLPVSAVLGEGWTEGPGPSLCVFVICDKNYLKFFFALIENNKDEANQTKERVSKIPPKRCSCVISKAAQSWTCRVKGQLEVGLLPLPALSSYFRWSFSVRPWDPACRGETQQSSVGHSQAATGPRLSAKSPNRISQIPSMIFVTSTGKCSKALGNSYGFYIIFEADTFLFPCAHHTYNVAELNRAIRVFTKYQCCHIRTEIHSLNNFSNTYLPPTTFQSSY